MMSVILCQEKFPRMFLLFYDGFRSVRVGGALTGVQPGRGKESTCLGRGEARLVEENAVDNVRVCGWVW